MLVFVFVIFFVVVALLLDIALALSVHFPREEMAAAYGNIGFVAAHHYLLAVTHDLAV